MQSRFGVDPGSIRVRFGMDSDRFGIDLDRFGSIRLIIGDRFGVDSKSIWDRFGAVS